ncbi:GNAT family N-acetyltransferase [Bacillus horti]|uniref:Ribosomal protein S18 acetylase RimI-like enzyme n=1 Tax=Caldalkalibacillus horti TaxID=77523 RepID=A0ABT9VZV5_9BACI|nr:GNAT family N-acetyltransferase [Bacillus horti]MDQ0166511.1 ribosomal protein S18 acetylase RimI-like enzyme [Bacillus horti]
MIKVVHAKEVNMDVRKKISEVYIDGFGEHLNFFSKDRKKLERALEHMFNLDVFYVALIDGEIAGITACTDGTVHSINHNKKELRKHLGWYKGTIANMVFKNQFQEFSGDVRNGAASVEFVATAREHRGKGVATAILNHLLTLPQYKEYILEGVADTNLAAIKLYEKLGYKEFKRTKQKHTRISGINYYLSMIYIKSAG